MPLSDVSGTPALAVHVMSDWPRWAGVLSAWACVVLCGCSRDEPAFLAPYTYKLQGTTVVSVGPPDALCGAAANEVGADAAHYVMQAPLAVELEASIEIEAGGNVIVSDGGGCSLPMQVNDAQDHLSISDYQCQLAEDAPVRQWGVTERKYVRLVLDFGARRWQQSLRSRASDNNGQANVQCAVGEGVIIGVK